MNRPAKDEGGEAVTCRCRVHELRAEADAVAVDPDDRAEVAAVLKDMEPLRAW